MVKLRSDQERVKALLKETITLLCKNGLEYKNRFCVDALIGITLDEDDVFLVKISETVGDKGLGNGTPVHLPPAPAPVMTLPPFAMHQQIFDLQGMKNSPFSFIGQQDSVISMPPSNVPNVAQRKSPTPPRMSAQPLQQRQRIPTPQSLNNDRKRRASSSPVRLTKAPSPDIPEHAATPGAISNASELSNHSIPTSEPSSHQIPTPISVQPDDTAAEEEDHDEQPQNLVKVKDEPHISDAENTEALSLLQTAPLNMSTVPSEPSGGDSAGCSTWDPSKIQQQVAQQAAAAISKAEHSPINSLANSPAPTTASEQDASSSSTISCSLLKTALGKQPQMLNASPQMTKQEMSEDEVNYLNYMTSSANTSGSGTPPSFSLEKRYVCDFAGCNYTSSRKYNLMRHGRTHHEDQRIPCPECPGTFVDKYILKEHMASAHAKFTVPIEGTNMIGVGISTMKAEEGSNSPGGIVLTPRPPGFIGPLLPSPNQQAAANKRKRSVPSHNPSPRRSIPGMSPGNKARKSGGWHIPRLAPMIAAPVTIAPITLQSKDALVTSMAGDFEQNNNSILSKESLASMQIVFPGMQDMMDIDNNNSVKPDEPPASPTTAPAMDLTSNMQVVFPGMEMVQQQQDDSNEPNSADTSPAKERSMIETSDGEDAKISE